MRPVSVVCALFLAVWALGCSGTIAGDDGGADAGDGAGEDGFDAGTGDDGAGGDDGSAVGDDGDADTGGDDGAAGGDDGSTGGDDGSTGGDDGGSDDGGDVGPQADVWVTAYFASWNHYAPPGGNWGNLPTAAIDWDAFSHMIYFALGAGADGSVGPIGESQNFNADRLAAIVPAAHAHGRPILYSVGGWGNTDFSQAIAPGVRATLIANLLEVMTDWGFDGVDVDMEPIGSGDLTNYRAFIAALRSALDTVDMDADYPGEKPIVGRPLLTAAVGWQPELFAELAVHFDQVNLMTYDMSGPWDGWVSWHNAPVTNGGHSFPSTGGQLPCAERTVQEFLLAGAPAAKLGIGLDFYGYRWQGGRRNNAAGEGVTAPLQGWANGSPPTVTANVPYYEIAADYGLTDGDETHPLYRWDDEAGVPYLSSDVSDPDLDVFLSYDNGRTAAEKIAFVRANSLGGIIIWELGGGYCADRPAGQRDELLQAVKQAAFGP